MFDQRLAELLAQQTLVDVAHFVGAARLSEAKILRNGQRRPDANGPFGYAQPFGALLACRSASAAAPRIR